MAKGGQELVYCSLGGAGEIGMNLNLFGYGKPGEYKWIIVDIGVTFSDDNIPYNNLIIDLDFSVFDLSALEDKFIPIEKFTSLSSLKLDFKIYNLKKSLSFANEKPSFFGIITSKMQM